MNKSENNKLYSSGFCTSCGTMHSLEAGSAVRYCHELMEKLDKTGRIDFILPKTEADPAFSTDYLSGKARGQMFGVMVYLDSEKRKCTARAFSGQYNGRWEVPGWVSPVINASEFYEITQATERKIKSIGRELKQLPTGSQEYKSLADNRKRLSQDLMRKIHAIYRLRNFKGTTSPMPDIIHGQKGIPTGTGDCCAPKLLNFAAVNGFTPLGIAEFYYGKENKSETKLHKHFYPSCTDKCGLILGFMLCGLDAK
ncbi:hypothetical protein [Maridesulfovibrio hydrothermalis]|uniref:Uncharacterized protein n=1 Tax=Maridesulfovibrio hydrothermalis AM13 = DSM 14728 TaxID=1121451 RepID=L0R9Q4_9BACT|nr:hypothetical protein [Maridesulfovibrio hydrothermalis]CCO23479.1 conserved exported protein of unknown function [Maridesulfovibrio hydrothermalis AM13 = DSM 14728]